MRASATMSPASEHDVDSMGRVIVIAGAIAARALRRTGRFVYLRVDAALRHAAPPPLARAPRFRRGGLQASVKQPREGRRVGGRSRRSSRRTSRPRRPRAHVLRRQRSALFAHRARSSHIASGCVQMRPGIVQTACGSAARRPAHSVLRHAFIGLLCAQDEARRLNRHQVDDRPASRGDARPRRRAADAGVGRSTAAS